MSTILRTSRSAWNLWIAKRNRERMANSTRISITLSAKALEIIEYVRNARESSAGLAIDYLILKTELQKSLLKKVDGLLVLDWNRKGPQITTEEIQRILADEYVYPRKTQKATARRTSVRISPEAIAIMERFRRNEGISTSEAVSRLIEESE